MPKLPVISGYESVRAMAKLGYVIERIRSSHMIIPFPGRPPLSGPRHRALDWRTLRGLLQDTGQSVEEISDWLN